MKLYNLFPRLFKDVTSWNDHFARISEMGFDWIYVNPIQETGGSRSLYSIRDYFKINNDFINNSCQLSADEQVIAVSANAKKNNINMMVDLVINHSASDSPLINQHPDWYQWENGQVAHPSCEEDGHRVVWGDLAKFNHHANGLYDYCKNIITYMIYLGFTGFRCDAAYQMPGWFWKKLIEDTKKEHPEVMFAAETLGCSTEQTWDCINAGFDYIFNSSKWWDFNGDWLLNMYNSTRHGAKSISFPESHDTNRLMSDCGGNVNILKQRYLFAACFSAGVMMPVGYEFGFRGRVHVCNTHYTHWEHQTGVDISDYIRAVNQLKTKLFLLTKESETYLWNHHHNNNILMMVKVEGDKKVLLILNKDAWNTQTFYTENLSNQIEGTLTDYSPDTEMGSIVNTTNYSVSLLPGQGKIIANF